VSSLSARLLVVVVVVGHLCLPMLSLLVVVAGVLYALEVVLAVFCRVLLKQKQVLLYK